MPTPDDFYNEFFGRAIDQDGVYGVQCVDGFKAFCAHYGLPVYGTGNGWASGYWYNRNKNGYAQYFDFVTSGFQNGDWVIWAYGSGSHPKSHIAMYYNGLEFGENQHSATYGRGFCTINGHFSDALGAYRWKGWTGGGSVDPDPQPDVDPVQNWIYGNRYLDLSEMQNNAIIIYRYLNQTRGWTLNAVAGMLGNMQIESTINPGVWQNLDENNYNLGFGLVQWTPATNYTNWANSKNYDINDGYGQLQWIDEETVNAGQWIATSEYPMSFDDFKISQDAPYNLAMAFLKNFERAGVEKENERKTAAVYWADFLAGVDPDDGMDDKDKKKKNKYNWVLFNRRRIGV